MDSSKLSCYFPNTVTILPLFLLSPLFFFYFIRLNSSHHVCPGYFQVRCFAFAPPRRGCTPGPVVIKRPRTRELIKDHCSGCVAILNCAGLRGTLVLYSWWDKNNSSYPQITFHRPRLSWSGSKPDLLTRERRDFTVSRNGSKFKVEIKS